MPAITYQDFSGGLDRRLPINVQEASRLWVLRNAYVTLGKRIRKRPGLRKISTEMAGLTGFKAVQIAGQDSIVMFLDVGEPYTPCTIFDGPVQLLPQLDSPPSASGSLLAHIHYADYFQGFLYVVAEYANGAIAHHYLDGSGPTYITDVNCPNSLSVTKAASRIFAINGETTAYCAAGDARDWTTASDAGFLPTSLQQDAGSSAKAVGTFQDALVVLFSQGAQVWDVAVDPSANALRKRLQGIGTDSPISLASFANDLAFLSSAGFRSMTVVQTSDRIDDTDFGVPIDGLVVADIANANEQVIGVWLPEFGQYWAIFNDGATSKVWAYTFSRSSKIACWSEYTFPILITGIANLAGRVYARTEGFIYELLPDQYTDDSEPIEVEVQLAFQDAKQPGVAKQFYGADYVVEGAPEIAVKYDPRDLGKESVPMTIPGDTRPGDMMPVEIIAPAIAPVFRHAADEAFELSAMTLYYHPLGIQS